MGRPTRNFVIIGAGPTSIGAVNRLFSLFTDGLLEDVSVTVLEREQFPGGLASTVTDEKGFSWDLGVHVTGASKYKSFVDVIRRSVPDWHCIQKVVKVEMKHVIQNGVDADANYVPYPVQQSVPYFPQQVKDQCLAELNQMQLQSSQHHDTLHFDNFDQFSRYFFGSTLQDVFIKPYNEKVWTVKLDEMNCNWVQGRVPKVNLESIQVRSALDLEDLLAFDKAHDISFFKYPANCLGMGELWKRVVAAYPKSWFRFNTAVRSIDADAKTITVQNRAGKVSQLDYDCLISSMPLTVLCGSLRTGLSPPQLKHSKVILVGVGLHLPHTSIAADLSWAYYPDKTIPFYRCTVISNFSPLLVPDPSKYWSVLCEVAAPSEVAESELKDAKQQLVQDTIDGLISVGVVRDYDQVYSTWTRVLDYGYPIPTIAREDQVGRAMRHLESKDIYSRGRFGGWKYEMSNQDCSFEIGQQLVDRIINNIPETIFTYQSAG